MFSCMAVNAKKSPQGWKRDLKHHKCCSTKCDWVYHERNMWEITLDSLGEVEFKRTRT